MSYFDDLPLTKESLSALSSTELIGIILGQQEQTEQPSRANLNTSIDSNIDSEIHKVRHQNQHQKIRINNE